MMQSNLSLMVMLEKRSSWDLFLLLKKRRDGGGLRQNREDAGLKVLTRVAAVLLRKSIYY